MEDGNKKIKWYALALMGFTAVWGGLGNVSNGFMYFNGVQVIPSWIMMFALYFVPYVLMVGELGSAFRSESGGVSAWLYRTKGAKFAYYAGWTYWAVHVTYIAGKGSGFLKALSWAIFRNAETYDTFPTVYVQLATLAVLLIACLIAARGINPMKKLLTIAGICSFIMSLLYIAMMFAAPAINPAAEFVKLDLSIRNLIPKFDVSYLTTLSVLMFAVGGCEKVSPYVNKVENPSRGFPKGMILLAIMVALCAILGSIAMGMMFDPADVQANFDSYVANGHYWAFQKLGGYYHIGDTLLIVYALCEATGIFSVLILCIDAPLRMLLDNENIRQFIPARLQKKNRHGVYINGIRMVAILSGSIILVQSFGPGAATVLRQLSKLNSVCMPMRYLWVFAAYLALRRRYDDIPADYRFVKNQHVARFFGIWCLVATGACCLMGMYAKDPLTLALNVVTPFVLLGLGLIMPLIAAREQRKQKLN